MNEEKSKEEILEIWKDIDFFLNGNKISNDEKYSIVIGTVLRNEEYYQKSSVFKIYDKKNDIVLEISEPSHIDFKIFNLIKMYKRCIVENQYNISSENIKDKIIVDIGSHVGIFSLYCAKLGAKEIYAFEPVSKTFSVLYNQIELNHLKDKIFPLQVALSDTQDIEEIGFVDCMDCGASLRRNSHILEKVVVVKLDTIANNKRIDFIKIDTEGNEKKVLEGSSDIIKRDKPILSVSAYHNPEDLIELYFTIKKIKGDYKINLLGNSSKLYYCD
jgi:FkbM family methyltransferase